MKTMMSKMLFVILFSLSSLAVASDLSDEAQQKLVIQVSTADTKTQNIALNNAVNVQKHFGMDSVAIEIVAYGPGLRLLTAESAHKGRVESLAMQGIRFSACGNTMHSIERKTGKLPVLLEGVEVAPAGVVRIMELQQQGYAYIRP